MSFPALEPLVEGALPQPEISCRVDGLNFVLKTLNQ
jgi:hypothetical protein